MERTLVSIVIPAFNEAKIIGQTLNKIRSVLDEQHADSISWEIIVCDNNSTDETAELATQAGALVVFEKMNQIGKARNVGAGRASGEWLLFIDADSYPSAELITEVYGIIESENYIGCGTTVKVVDGTLFNKLRMERLNPLFRLFNFCGGAFLLCRQDAFEGINGFNTDLYALEEIDFVLRLKRYGKKQKKKFIILSRYPVMTSGRKGDYRFSSMATLFMSNLIAVALFGARYVLPKRLIRGLAARFLGYWYKNRR